MQSLECVELLLFVLLPKMSVPDIKYLGLQCVFVSGITLHLMFVLLEGYYNACLSVVSRST